MKKKEWETFKRFKQMLVTKSGYDIIRQVECYRTEVFMHGRLWYIDAEDKHGRSRMAIKSALEHRAVSLFRHLSQKFPVDIKKGNFYALSQRGWATTFSLDICQL